MYLIYIWSYTFTPSTFIRLATANRDERRVTVLKVNKLKV